MWVKICANTNVEDAKLAAELGAEAVGFVFAPSSRRMTVEQVAAITPDLPTSGEKIGVFHELDLATISNAVKQAGLTGVQMHAPLDVDFARQLHAAFDGKIQLIQTVHWNLDGTEEDEAAFEHALHAAAAEPVIARILVDSKKGSATGGTGLAAPWARLAAYTKGIAKPIILAGGLKTKNIAQAIAEIVPWGVDVASGVEAEPGRKDPVRMRAFIGHAHGAGNHAAAAKTNG